MCERRAFVASCPVAATQRAVTRSLCRRGLLRFTGREQCDCVIQWAPFSKIAWTPVIEGHCLASSYYLHHGLVNKEALYAVLRAAKDASPSGSVLHTCVVPTLPSPVYLTDASSVAVAAACVAEAGGYWVLKAVSTNNALGVLFFEASAFADVVVRAKASTATEQPDSASVGGVDSTPELQSVGESIESSGGGSSGGGSVAGGGGGGSSGGGGGGDGSSEAQNRTLGQAWVLQQYVHDPLLVRGRKFHMRVNVLAVGNLGVFVHDHIVCHVASEPFVVGDWTNEARHITNHGVQRSLPSYSRETCTVLLPDLVAMLATEHGGSHAFTVDACWRRVVDVVVAVFRSLEAHPKLFMPMPHCFEVFGFDILPRADGSLVLLEVNGGPALEGVAMPDVCAALVEEVLQVVLDPVLTATAGRGVSDDDGTEGPAPADDSAHHRGFSFVYEKASVPSGCGHEHRAGDSRMQCSRCFNFTKA